MAKRNFEDFTNTWLYPDYKRPKQVNPFEAFKENNSSSLRNGNILLLSQTPNIASKKSFLFKSTSTESEPDLKSVDLSALDAYTQLLNNINRTKKNDLTSNQQHSLNNYFTTPVTSKQP